MGGTLAPRGPHRGWTLHGPKEGEASNGPKYPQKRSFAPKKASSTRLMTPLPVPVPVPSQKDRAFYPRRSPKTEPQKRDPGNKPPNTTQQHISRLFSTQKIFFLHVPVLVQSGGSLVTQAQGCGRRSAYKRSKYHQNALFHQKRPVTSD